MELKKKKGLIIMLLVLCALLAVYFALRSRNQKHEEQRLREEAAAEIHVTDTDAGDIISLRFDTGGEALAFEKEDGRWYDADDPDFPLNQDITENIAEQIGNITADRKLEDADALEDYGLNEPEYTMEYTDASGETVTVDFGDLTGDYYYVCINGDRPVYTVNSSLVDGLDYTRDDLAVLDEYPSIGSGNLVRISVTQNGETVSYDSENEDQSEDIAAAAGGLGAVTLSDAADYSAEDADMEKYGLDQESRITVEAVYTENEEENTLFLYIGDEDGEGSRYVMIGDSRIVYLISDEVCRNIMNS